MQNHKHYVDIIFIIVLICVFALSSVMLTILGVNIYKEASVSDSRQELGTASLYFAQKIRQCEDKSSVRIEDLDGGIPSLVLETTVEGTALQTVLFVYDGSLKEITAVQGSDVEPEFGQEIMALSEADFAIEDGGLLKIHLTSEDGNSAAIHLYLVEQGGDGS